MLMVHFIAVCWSVTCQLAPWLLFGMLLSGMLHVLLPEGFIRRRFQGVSGVFQAVAFGVPLPLCSCGVVPAGVGLKNDGASDGASVGFLISTPQTGVDSVLVSVSFFGWPFALFKMATAFVLGVVGGLIADKIPSADIEAKELKSCCSGGHETTQQQNPVWRAALHSIEIFRSIWLWLFIGVLISAAIEVWVPAEWVQSVGELGLFPAMLLVLLISTPLYVCATASVPIAAVLISQGLPTAAALVFLMAGPATNTTTIGAIWGRFGWRVLGTYLTTIVVGSMVAALLFDWLVPISLPGIVADGHHHHVNWFAQLCAAFLVVLSAFFGFEWLKNRSVKEQPQNEESSLPKVEERVQLRG